MVNPSDLYHALARRGSRFFTGVPDSLLKPFCAYVNDKSAPGEHVIAANEGNAVALAAGHHLATGLPGVVYMQNSGLGNAVNPLTSLTDPEVYRIPLLLIVGWRGEPGVKDEPQHIKQGRITPAMLELLNIPFWIMDGDSDLERLCDQVFGALAEKGSPVALLVRKNTFTAYKEEVGPTPPGDLLREAALDTLLKLIAPDDLVISTTGKTSRELYELRVERGEAPRDFLTVGSMGHTLSIAVGVALAKRDRRVICLDGDGSMLMHLGALAVSGALAPLNLTYVLLNNAAHESVGGQPTVAGKIDLKSLSTACGFSYYGPVADVEELGRIWKSMGAEKAPRFLELRLRCGSRADLGRPATTCEENKIAFMEKMR